LGHSHNTGSGRPLLDGVGWEHWGSCVVEQEPGIGCILFGSRRRFDRWSEFTKALLDGVEQLARHDRLMLAVK
jgi:hypothetical protein